MNLFPIAYAHFSPKHLEEILLSPTLLRESLPSIFFSSFFVVPVQQVKTQIRCCCFTVFSEKPGWIFSKTHVHSWTWREKSKGILLRVFFGSTLNLTWFLIPTGSEWFPSVVCFGITYKAANPSALFSCSWIISRAALQCWNNPWRTHLFIKPLESLCEKCLLLIFSPLLLLALASLDALREPEILVTRLYNQNSWNVTTLLVLPAARSQHATKCKSFLAGDNPAFNKPCTSFSWERFTSVIILWYLPPFVCYDLGEQKLRCAHL